MQSEEGGRGVNSIGAEWEVFETNERYVRKDQHDMQSDSKVSATKCELFENCKGGLLTGDHAVTKGNQQEMMRSQKYEMSLYEKER